MANLSRRGREILADLDAVIEQIKAGDSARSRKSGRSTPSTPTTGSPGAETGFGTRVFDARQREPFDINRAEVMTPAPTEGSDRPRVLQAAYDREAQTIHVQFRDGTEWEYYNATPHVWGRYKRYKSSNRFINNVANGLPYAEAPEYVWGGK